MAVPAEQSVLLAGLRRGDGGAFAEAFERFADPVYRLALSLLHEKSDADDVVQEVFLSLLEKIATFEGRSRLETWLYRVAYNASITRLRLARREVLSEDIDTALPEPTVLADWRDLPEAMLEEAELADALREAIAGLPEALRVTSLLRDVEGLTTAEAAEVLGISPGAVKVRLHRARLLLRDRLSARLRVEPSPPAPPGQEGVTCWELLEYLSDYIDRDLDESLRADVQRHVQTCPNCHIILGTTERTILLVQADQMRVVPAADRRRRLFDQLQAAFLARPAHGV